MHVACHRIGTEQQPVAVLTDMCADPDALIDEAATLPFQPLGPHYPGVRARIPTARLDMLISPVLPLIGDIFGLRGRLALIDAFYSLVTTPPAALAPIQRFPHFDGLEGERLALLLFLSRDAPSGTAFYRHRATGFETIDRARFPAYRRAMNAEAAARGLPGPGYIHGDTDRYQEIARFDGRFNRALLYRGHLLHCAHLPDALSLSDDPRRGRLTANIFLMGR